MRTMALTSARDETEQDYSSLRNRAALESRDPCVKDTTRRPVSLFRRTPGTHHRVATHRVHAHQSRSKSLGFKVRQSGIFQLRDARVASSRRRLSLVWLVWVAWF